MPTLQKVLDKGRRACSHRDALASSCATSEPDMKLRSILLLAAMLLAAYALGPGHAAPGDDETPIGPKWWPSKWGASDQRGAANLLTPEKVLEARSLITAGKVYQLGRVYEQGMPIPGKRHYSLTIPGLPPGQPSGANA